MHYFHPQQYWCENQSSRTRVWAWTWGAEHPQPQGRGHPPHCSPSGLFKLLLLLLKLSFLSHCFSSHPPVINWRWSSIRWSLANKSGAGPHPREPSLPCHSSATFGVCHRLGGWRHEVEEGWQVILNLTTFCRTNFWIENNLSWFIVSYPLSMDEVQLTNENLYTVYLRTLSD